MRRRFGLSVAVIVSLDGCVDDPTFTLADAGVDAAGGTSSSSGGSGTSGTSSSSSTSSTGGPVTDGGDTGRCSLLACKLAGGSCSGDTCIFNVSANANRDVVCPTGSSCQVTCNGKSACKTVMCAAGENACSLNCSGDQACTDQITLGAKSSTLLCTGKDACKKVTCNGDSCAVTCNGMGCEPKDVKCCASTCTVNGMKGDCK